MSSTLHGFIEKNECENHTMKRNDNTTVCQLRLQISLASG